MAYQDNGDIPKELHNFGKKMTNTKTSISIMNCMLIFDLVLMDCMALVMVYYLLWIDTAGILLGIFPSMFMRDTGLDYFLDCQVWR